jgi:hypothetical protein
MSKGLFRRHYGAKFCDQLAATAVEWHNLHGGQINDVDEFADSFVADLLKQCKELSAHRHAIREYLRARFGGPHRLPLRDRVESVRWHLGLGNARLGCSHSPMKALNAEPPFDQGVLILPPAGRGQLTEFRLQCWALGGLEWSVFEIRQDGHKPRWVERILLFGRVLFERDLGACAFPEMKNITFNKDILAKGDNHA